MAGFNTLSSAQGKFSASSVNTNLNRQIYKRKFKPEELSAACTKGNHHRCYVVNCICKCGHPTK